MDRKKIDRYIESYFDATLSQEQERELRAFLASSQAEDPKYDEIRAVMGFFSVGRSLEKRRRARSFGAASVLKVTAVAASIVGAFLLGLNINLEKAIPSEQREVCYAYINGEVITEPTIVMCDVENTLIELISGGVDVDGQLSEFFGQ